MKWIKIYYNLKIGISSLLKIIRSIKQLFKKEILK